MYGCEPVEKRVLVIFGALYQALFLMVSMCVTLALVYLSLHSSHAMLEYLIILFSYPQP